MTAASMPGLIARHHDECRTGAPPQGCNSGKRAGDIGDAFRLGQNKSIEPLFRHQPPGVAPIKKISSQPAYFVVRL
jgi:hypothetical protein